MILMKEKLKKILRNSYSPYSDVKVSAIITLNDGREFYGVNVENSVFPIGVCAEKSAIVSAISNGAKIGDFKSIDIFSSLDHKLYPCGACRQIMVEFFTNETIIIIHDNNSFEKTSLDKLLPNSINKGSFGWK